MNSTLVMYTVHIDSTARVSNVQKMVVGLLATDAPTMCAYCVAAQPLTDSEPSRNSSSFSCLPPSCLLFCLLFVCLQNRLKKLLG